jgi:hypothetical protein
MKKKHHSWMIRALLIGSLASVSACVAPGNFCDVVLAPLEFEGATSSQIVATDRPTGESIAAQNAYWRSNCT